MHFGIRKESWKKSEKKWKVSWVKWEEIQYLKISDSMKAFLRGMLILLSSYIKKSEKSRIINLIFSLYSLVKQQTNTKISSRLKVIKAKTKINEFTIKKECNENVAGCFFEKII